MSIHIGSFTSDLSPVEVGYEGSLGGDDMCAPSCGSGSPKSELSEMSIVARSLTSHPSPIEVQGEGSLGADD
ncbi:hypothetical protein KXX03_005388, partial [Aspergillus fumigatus]